MGAMKIAIVGSGISGLTSAYLISKKHDVTIFEGNDYVGGHTHTVPVTLEQVQSYDHYPADKILTTVAHARHFGQALRAEGFDPSTACILRVWPQPLDAGIVDPMVDMERFAKVLSSDGSEWSVVSGWFVAQHRPKFPLSPCGLSPLEKLKLLEI